VQQVADVGVLRALVREPAFYTTYAFSRGVSPIGAHAWQSPFNGGISPSPALQ